MFSGFRGLVVCAASVALLAGCGGVGKTETIGDVIKDVGRWNMSSEQKAKYAHLSQNEARTLFVRDTYMDKVGVIETEAERNRLTAAVYLNYMMMQGQAIPIYCKRVNVDISDFQSAFYRNHRREEAGIAKILAAEGTSLEQIHTEFVPKYKTAAKYELMSTGSSYSACKTIKEKSSQLLGQVGFSKYYPSIAGTLRNMN